jgi:hypothetical protein
MKDLRVEEWLKTFGVGYTYHAEIALASVVIDKATKEQIRLTEVLDEELVQRYALALESKADFPGIILFPLRDASKSSTKAYGLINGWHRCEAYSLAERKRIPAYVVDVHDTLMIAVLRRTANTLEGKGQSPEERMEHAVWLTTQGYTSADASRFMMVPAKRLGDRLLFDNVRLRLAQGGMALDDLGLSVQAVARMSRLRDQFLPPVATLAHEARLTNDATLELIRQVREAPSDLGATKIISDWRERYKLDIQQTRGGRVALPGSPIRRLPVVLKQAERLMEQRGKGLQALRPEQLRQLITVCRNAIGALQATIRDAEEVLSDAS